MREHRKWIYQSRDVSEPWAIRITARKERTRIRADTLFFADWVRHDKNRLQIPNVSLDGDDVLVNEIETICAMRGRTFTSEDRDQLSSELKNLRESFDK